MSIPPAPLPWGNDPRPGRTLLKTLGVLAFYVGIVAVCLKLSGLW